MLETCIWANDDILIRSINFFVYGNGKQVYADVFNGGKENAAVHLAAAATAGMYSVKHTAELPLMRHFLILQE